MLDITEYKCRTLQFDKYILLFGIMVWSRHCHPFLFFEIRYLKVEGFNYYLNKTIMIGETPETSKYTQKKIKTKIEIKHVCLHLILNIIIYYSCLFF
jgi:hypothetical protein